MEQEARIEVRIRNNRLWKAIHSTHASVRAFCREYGLNESLVGRLLNLKTHLRNRDGSFRRICLSLSETLKILPEDLFPDRLYELEAVEGVMETDTLMLTEADREIALLPDPDDPFRAVVQTEVLKEVMRVLERLGARQRDIVVSHLGLEGGPSMTFVELAEKYGVSRSRVTQIFKDSCRLIEGHVQSERTLQEKRRKIYIDV